MSAGSLLYFSYIFFKGVLCVLLPLPPLRGQHTVLCHPRWLPTSGLTEFAVCWEGAGFEPRTTALQSGALPLSYLSSYHWATSPPPLSYLSSYHWATSPPTTELPLLLHWATSPPTTELPLLLHWATSPPPLSYLSSSTELPLLLFLIRRHLQICIMVQWDILGKNRDFRLKTRCAH